MIHPELHTLHTHKYMPCYGRVRCQVITLMYRVGQNHTFMGTYSIQCTFGVLSKEITIHTVMYGAGIQLWPTLLM
jgi:hypothetical protein